MQALIDQHDAVNITFDIIACVIKWNIVFFNCFKLVMRTSTKASKVDVADAHNFVYVQTMQANEISNSILLYD